MTPELAHAWPKRVRTAILVLAAATGLLMFGAHGALNVWPQMGARGAEILRRFAGQRVVATLETAALEVEDELHRGVYRLRGMRHDSPWSPVETQIQVRESRESWTLPRVEASIEVPGEGVWEAYLLGDRGRVVAQRTLLHPDPSRPYAFAAIVAFDLGATRLHFVLGSQEPLSPVPMRRTGRIPAMDARPDRLLAAFNGGFKAEHGHFGAMVAGEVALPPRPGLGTLAIEADGSVHLGVWGSEIVPSATHVAWRQNGPLIVHNGEIDPHTADVDPQDWGVTVGHATATWRSAIGLSPDGTTLYYIAGHALTLPALARAARAVGAVAAMQLDINNYWVHFDAFQARGARLRALPLLADMKAQDDSRYLGGFSRDFFYVTSADPPRR